MSLDRKQRHILRLLKKDDIDEWCTVSEAVLPIITDIMPSTLVEIESINGTHRARLTPEGKVVAYWMSD